MENLDIIILTTIVSTLFIVFGILMYKEFSNMEKNGYQHDPNAKKYGRDALFVVMQRLFDGETIPKKEKKAVYQAMFRTIADMESDGVYFDDDIKRMIIDKKEELYCEYSGLPSPKAYEIEVKV
jgi:hypothetical protein